MKNASGFDNGRAGDDLILSFCMPTLNRANELRVSLESIVRQAIPRVEIVIIDGGSTDETRDVIDSFRERFPEIRVYESETKSGVDRDILQSVEMARGRYCWLFSDDDFIKDGALRKVLDVIELNPGIRGISTNYEAYDSNLEYTIATAPAIAYRRFEESHVFDNREECFSHLGIHLGFISCQVVERGAWMRVAQSEDIGTQCNAWIIVYMIGRMLDGRPSWYYLHDVCVGYRSGNDSFIARVGVMKRQEITHLHYANTIGAMFPKGSPVYRSVFRILLVDRMPRTLAVLKSKGIPVSVQLSLFKMYFMEYRSYFPFWFRVMPIFFVPNKLLAAVKHLYSGWRRRRPACCP